MDNVVEYILSDQTLRLIDMYGYYLSLGKEEKRFSVDEILHRALVVAIRDLTKGRHVDNNV